jgi:acyl-coenzyme A synthetase/AMP-(fatty) acid ligase
MINVMGSKMHPSEIESVALRFDSVEDALARATPDGHGGVTIQLDVVCSGVKQVSDELQDHMRKNLHRFFVPKKIHIVSKISRTELGSKILRREERQ